MRAAKTAAVLGCGALGTLIAEGIARDLDTWRLAGVMARAKAHAEHLGARLGCPGWTSIEDMLAAGPSLVVEAAGAEAVRRYGEDILAAGSDLVLLSSGVLADAEFSESLREAALRGGSVLHAVAGAVGGFDVLRALAFRKHQLARQGRADGLRVRVDNVKAPASLQGAPWLEGRALPADRVETVFSGTAMEAIAAFPKNVNVAVATAAASAGVENTVVTMTSDPNLKENTHRVTAEGYGVRVSMEFASAPDPANPRSSTLSAWSVLALLDELTSPVRFF